MLHISLMWWCYAAQKHKHHKARKRRHVSVSSSSGDNKVLGMQLFVSYMVVAAVLIGTMSWCSGMA